MKDILHGLTTKKRKKVIIKKCIQCGECCKKQVCFIGREIWPYHTPPCPALLYEDCKYWCGFIKYGELLHPSVPDFVCKCIGVGVGCTGDEGAMGTWKNITQSIWGDISDEAIDFLLWECTGFPIYGPSEIIKRLRYLYKMTNGDLSQINKYNI